MLAEIQQAIAARPDDTRLVVLSDFDGTLADFHPDPTVPRPSAETARILARLARRSDLTLGVVSGRRIADLRPRLELSDHVYLAGLHGLEIEVDARRWQHPDLEEARRHVRQLFERLDEVREQTPGLLLEDKDASIAVHVRAVAAERQEAALAEADRLAADWVTPGRLRRMRGNLVLEFLPDIDANKGHAVTWIARDVEAHTGASPWVVYIGDDVTDEDAFAVITEGVGVLVGSRDTRASHRIADTSEVATLLAWLADSAP